jgi:hypothetical protein
MEGYFELTARMGKKPEAQEILDSIVRGKTNIGVASLSDTLNNDLMWTHYAKNWSGICIQFHAQRLVNALPSDATVVRMAYNEEPSWVGVRDGNNVDSAVKKVLSQKKYNWAYEREWRVLGSKGRVLIDHKKVISCVYLGPRIHENHSLLVRSSLTRAGIKFKMIKVHSYAINAIDFDQINRF